MAVNKGEIGIYGVLRRDGGNNILAKTDQIQDANTNKTQAEVNQEAFVLSSRINDISTRVSDLELKTGKVINYKGSVRDKTALDALYPKFGDVYKVESTIIIDNKKYPADTKFIHIGTNQNGEKAWEPLGGIALSQSNEALFIDDTGIGLRLGSGFKEPGGVLLLDLGSGLTCEQMGLTIATGGGLQLSYDGKLYVDTGEGLNIEHGKLSISCGNGLVVGTQGDKDNKLLINHGYSISVNDKKIDVNCGAGLVITTRGLNVIAGEGITTNNGKVGIFYDNSLTVGSSKMLSVNTDFSGGIITGQYGLRINVGSTLKVKNNNVEINPGLGISTLNGKVNVFYGDCFYVGEDNRLQLALSSGPLYSNNGKLSIKCNNGLIVSTNYDSVELGLKLTSSPLYMDNNNHISIRCGNGLRITTDYINNYTARPELCVNYGNTLYISNTSLEVRISTVDKDDSVPGLIISDSSGLYISSSKLAQFIKQVMATP